MLDEWTISNGYLQLIEKWKNEGYKYIFPQKKASWEACVEDYATHNNFFGKDIECALVIMKELNSGKPLSEIAKLINSTMHKNAIYFQYTNKLVLEYSKRGPEYFRFFGGKTSNLIPKFIKQIEFENKRYKKALEEQATK